MHPPIAGRHYEAKGVGPSPPVGRRLFSCHATRMLGPSYGLTVCLPRVVPPTVRRFPKADHDPDDARVPRLWRHFLWKADAVDPHSSLERAFELARSGRYASIDEIKQRLKAELYDQHMIEGRSLRSQLRALIAKSRAQL